MTRAPLRVGVLGAGTVGREVVRAFLDAVAASSRRRDGASARARRRRRPRHRPGARSRHPGRPPDRRSRPTSSLDPTRRRRRADGRRRAGADADRRRAGAGKAVVTANKHVSRITAPSSRRSPAGRGPPLRFEAAVGGRHPGPRAARRRTSPANRVTAVRGHRQRHHELHPHARWRARAWATTTSLADAQAARLRRGRPDRATSRATTPRTSSSILARLAFGVWLDPAAVVRRPRVRGDGRGRPGITGCDGGGHRGAPSTTGDDPELLATAPASDDGRSRRRSCRRAVPVATALGATDGVLQPDRDRGATRSGGRVRGAGRGWRGDVASAVLARPACAIARGRGVDLGGPAAPAVERPSIASARAGAASRSRRRPARRYPTADDPGAPPSAGAAAARRPLPPVPADHRRDAAVDARRGLHAARRSAGASARDSGCRTCTSRSRA